MQPPMRLPDDFFWMRDDKRKDEDVLSHLRLENEYTASVMKPLKAQEDAYYAELLSHVQETDERPAYPWGPDWLYYDRTVKGESYPLRCRKSSAAADAPEQLLLNTNALAEGKEHCDVQRFVPSPDHSLVAHRGAPAHYK